jgi:hypothetical protein
MATGSSSSNSFRPFSWWKAFGIFLGLVLIFLLCLLAPIYLTHRGNQQRLQAAIAAIRASGDPVDGHDLNRQLAERRADPNYSAEYQEIYRSLTALEESTKEDRQRLWKLDNQSYNYTPDVKWYRFEEFEAFYLKRKPIIDRLQELLLSSKLYVPENDYVSSKIEDQSHEFTELREYMRWLSRKYRVHATYQDWPECNAALIAKIIAASRHPHSTQSFRASIIPYATGNIPEYLEYCNIADNELQQLQTELERIDLPQEFAAGLIAERANKLQKIQTLTLESFLDPKDLQPAFWMRNKPLSELFPGNCADFLELYEQLIEELESLDVNHFALWSKLNAMHLANQQETLKKDSSQNKKNDVLKKMSGNNLVNREWYIDECFYYARVIYKMQTVAEIMATSVAIKRFRAQYGHLPEKLENLMPEFIDQLPIDFYTQRPLMYVVDQHVMKLYSAGENEIAEGGYDVECYQQKDTQGNLEIWSRVATIPREVTLSNGNKLKSSDDIGIELNFGLGDALRRANQEPASH